jgi:hypothetical protein
MAAVNERGQKSRSEGQKSRSFRPTGTIPHLSGNDTAALTWEFPYELNAGPSPRTGRGPRLGRRKTRLTCGAPLRNRTVDLLLTIHNFPGSLPGRRFPQASNGADLATATVCDRSGHRTRCEEPSGHGAMRSERQRSGRLTCLSGPARGAAYRPATSTPTVTRRSWQGGTVSSATSRTCRASSKASGSRRGMR